MESLNEFFTFFLESRCNPMESQCFIFLFSVIPKKWVVLFCNPDIIPTETQKVFIRIPIETQICIKKKWANQNSYILPFLAKKKERLFILDFEGNTLEILAFCTVQFSSKSLPNGYNLTFLAIKKKNDCLCRFWAKHFRNFRLLYCRAFV